MMRYVKIKEINKGIEVFILSLQFVLNTADEDIVEDLLTMSGKWLDKSMHHEVFYLVPNHVKFETEINVLKKMHTLPKFSTQQYMASMRLQVFSFSRLAWYYMQQTKSYQATRLSDSGKFMLIRKSLITCKDDLVLFKREVDRPGFIQQLLDLFNELQQGNISPFELKEVIESVNTLESTNQEDYVTKLVDIQLIYQTYQDMLISHHIADKDLLTELALFLQDKDLSHVQFIVSGFTNFTAIEKQLIETLMRVAGEVKMNFVLDQAPKDNTLDSYQLFYNTSRMYQDLYHVARENSIPVMFDYRKKVANMTPMRQLASEWQNLQELVPKKLEDNLVTNVLSLWSCTDTYQEVKAIGTKIRGLVSTEGYRYEEIALISRDIETYTSEIMSVFDDMDIPYYINEEEDMVNHPLVEWLRSLFKIDESFYQYKDVMRFLRTELCFPDVELTKDFETWEEKMQAFRQAIDYTENVVLAYGYSGSDWIKKSDWEYVTYQYDTDEESLDNEQIIQEQSNDIRHLIRDYLPNFFKEIKQATTTKEAIVLFYQFLLAIGVDRQLQAMQQQEIERGNLTEAKNHEQTWQALMDLMDEYYNVLGEDVFEFEIFKEILLSGLEGVSYSKVPTSIDEVVVTSLDRVRAKKYRATFIFGATDQVLPKKIDNKTLLSNEERDVFSQLLRADSFLNNSLTESMANEPFIFYLALLSATEKIVLSAPKNRDQVKDVKASPYVEQLSRHFAIPIEHKEAGLVADETVLDSISTDKILLSDLIGAYRTYEENKECVPWLFLQLEKRVHKELPVASKRLFASLTHKNIPETLDNHSVDTLYGDTIYASVSKIENFYQCQYKYFLRYGLGLQEREQFELSPAAAGEFYHEALDLFFKELIKQKVQLTNMTDDEVNRLAQTVLQEVLGDKRFSILSTTNRMKYVSYQLEKTIQRVCLSLKEQAKRSNMTPIQTEVLFGESLKQAGLNSLEIVLNNKKKVKVRGKIDRLDKMVLEDDIYLSVVDYKSSKHNFDFVDAYYGLAMQMITYLDVALTNAVELVGQTAKPAGALYMHIKNPVISVDEKFSLDTLDERLLEEYKYNGLLVEDELILENLDKTIDPQVKSLVYPYQQLKSGKMKSASFVSSDDLSSLVTHNRENFKEAGEKIYEGSTKLNPAYKEQKRIACGFCPYRSVCQFDVMLPENNYHRLESLDKEMIIEKIQTELKEETNE